MEARDLSPAGAGCSADNYCIPTAVAVGHNLSALTGLIRAVAGAGVARSHGTALVPWAFPFASPSQTHSIEVMPHAERRAALCANQPRKMKKNDSAVDAAGGSRQNEEGHGQEGTERGYPLWKRFQDELKKKQEEEKKKQRPCS